MIESDLKVDLEENKKQILEIIMKLFNLSQKQAECFIQLRRYADSGTCITNIVGDMQSERSLVQKQLKFLLKQKLVVRKSVTLTEFQERCRIHKRIDLMPTQKKGYLYLYSPISDDEIIMLAEATWQNWKIKLQDHFSNA